MRKNPKIGLLLIIISPIIFIFVISYWLFFIPKEVDINWKTFTVEGDSMLPTFHHEQFVEVIPCNQECFSQLERGDVIVIYLGTKEPDAESMQEMKKSGIIDKRRFFIKRIIALPGEKLSFSKDGDVYINERILNEPYLKEPHSTWLHENEINKSKFFVKEIIIPERNFYALGDNRIYSADSRTYGVVPYENIQAYIKFLDYNREEQKPTLEEINYLEVK